MSEATPSEAPFHATAMFRTCLWLHRWTGLLAAPFFLVLCLTGSVLIFHDEVDRFLGDAPPVAAAPPAPLGLDGLAAAALAHAPGMAMQYLGLDPDTPDRARAGVARPGEKRLSEGRPLLLDRGTGRLLPFSPPQSTFTGVLLKVHSKWFAGLPGQLFGSVVGLFVFICLATGLIIYGPYVRRLAFGAVRRGRSSRVVQLDLHNFFGVVVLGWAAVVSVTGIFLGIGTLLITLWQNTGLKAMAGDGLSPPPALVSVETAAAAAKTAMPERTFKFVFFPGTEFSSPRHYTFLIYGSRAYNNKLFDVVLVDAGTGAVSAASPLPWYLQLILVSEPLHFGNYGGLILKLLWIASTWLALFITGNGAWLWWSKRRARAASVAETEAFA
jgi:uncharacterized iron-regulated membrane protein